MLPGGTRTNADYISFPSRRFDGLTNMTIEIWATPTAARNWGRVVDIGDGVTTGTSFLLSFSQGTDINQQRLEFKPSGARIRLFRALSTQYHYVITWDSAAGDAAGIATDNSRRASASARKRWRMFPARSSGSRALTTAAEIKPPQRVTAKCAFTIAHCYPMKSPSH